VRRGVGFQGKVKTGDEILVYNIKMALNLYNKVI
jgi:hypothetical protein